MRSTSLRSHSAPGARPISGASAPASALLPTPESPPTATSRGGAASQKLDRAIEIAAGKRARFVALFALEPLGAGRLDLGANGGAQAQEQRQRDEAGQSLRRLGGKIAVEEPVGGGAQTPLLQIHQKKGQIVENVAARNLVGKLDRVEQRRLAVEENDVAQVQIAVTAANETGLAALEQDWAHVRECEPRIVGKLARRRRIEEIGPLGESRAVLLDVSFERMRGARCVPERGASVHAADDERQLVDDRVRNAAPVGDAIERRVLVESPHMDDPFDDFAIAPERERLLLAE